MRGTGREAAGWAFPCPGHSPPALPKARGSPPALLSPIPPAGRLRGRLGSQIHDPAPSCPWRQLGPCVSPAPALAQLPPINTTSTKAGAAPRATGSKKGTLGTLRCSGHPTDTSGDPAEHPASLALLQPGSAPSADLWLPVDLSPPWQEVNQNKFFVLSAKNQKGKEGGITIKNPPALPPQQGNKLLWSPGCLQLQFPGGSGRFWMVQMASERALGSVQWAGGGWSVPWTLVTWGRFISTAPSDPGLASDIKINILI